MEERWIQFALRITGGQNNMFWEWFRMGGPVMWPLLAASVVALAVVIERILFIMMELDSRDPAVVGLILSHTESGDIKKAVEIGRSSKDFVARTLSYGLAHRQRSFSNALLQAAGRELQRFSRGLPVLDTIVTLAPLLGLLGTVTGLIRSFGLLGANELQAPAAITGGIAEALIATAFGLSIAIVALIPFNYLGARVEEARHEIEDASTHLEMLLMEPARRE